MKFLSNTYNPKLPDASVMLTRQLGETVQVVWKNYSYWLQDKIIGDPQATDDYTVEQLKSMNMVGVYSSDSQ